MAAGRTGTARAGPCPARTVADMAERKRPAAARVGRVAGRQNAATPAGSRAANKMTGSLFESKNYCSHLSIGLEPSPSVIIALLHCTTENIGL